MPIPDGYALMLTPCVEVKHRYCEGPFKDYVESVSHGPGHDKGDPEPGELTDVGPELDDSPEGPGDAPSNGPAKCDPRGDR